MYLLEMEVSWKPGQLSGCLNGRCGSLRRNGVMCLCLESNESWVMAARQLQSYVSLV